MNIREFAAQYCKDIVEYVKNRSMMFDLSGFSYDEIMQEDDGTEVKVVNTVNYQIPITDILSMDRSEFAKVWPYPECLDAYDSYVSTLIIVEGEEALTMIRGLLNSESEKIEAYETIPEVFR